VNQPTPALVPQRAAQRLPRLPLWLLCAAYVLPGVIGRDPWRNADITAYAYMLGMAQGRTSWLAPTVGGLPADKALLPHWLGAGFIKLLPWLDPALAARLPFVLLLALTLALVWYSMFHLARTEAAQPVPFAFGGEADPVDYARALADGALLALVATLGLLQLGHETTPELVQLSEVGLLLWAMSAAPFRPQAAVWAAAAALPGLALSGAPSLALALGLGAAGVCFFSNYAQVRRFAWWLLGLTLLAGILASWIDAWHWHLAWPSPPGGTLGLMRQLLWFTWPTWPLGLWTLWRWRRHLMNRHIAVPLCLVLISTGASLLMGGQDRVQMLALPSLAILAAFALPTLQRSAGAAIDWFSVFFFSLAALTVWVIYASMQLGVPAKPLANILRLAPGFEPRFQALELIFAALGTLAWLWLVRWRTARHRHALWKSLVLPASGVALAWLLTMTLLLPVLDYARSPRPLVALLLKQVPPGSCVMAQDVSRHNLAGLEVFGAYQIHHVGNTTAGVPATASACDYWLVQVRQPSPAYAPPSATWKLATKVRHPADKREQIWVYLRKPGSASGG